MRFHISAKCWSRQGRPSSWSGKQVDASDVTDAVDQADRLLARAGHHRYEITATEIAPQEEQPS